MIDERQDERRLTDAGWVKNPDGTYTLSKAFEYTCDRGQLQHVAAGIVRPLEDVVVTRDCTDCLEDGEDCPACGGTGRVEICKTPGALTLEDRRPVKPTRKQRRSAQIATEQAIAIRTALERANKKRETVSVPVGAQGSITPTGGKR
jgi:hypothetical protein